MNHKFKQNQIYEDWKEESTAIPLSLYQPMTKNQMLLSKFEKIRYSLTVSSFFELRQQQKSSADIYNSVKYVRCAYRQGGNPSSSNYQLFTLERS